MLEIPQLCACGTGYTFTVIQAALNKLWTGQCWKMQLSTQSGCSETFFPVLIGGRMTSAHQHAHFISDISHVPVANFPIVTFT